MKKIKTYAILAIFALFHFACSNNANDQNKTEDLVDEHAGHNHLYGHQHQDEANGSKVYFLSPADNATVSSPVEIKMGVSGMEVEVAGAINEGKGHHHLIINGSYIDMGVAIPFDEKHIHFGKGQTDTLLALEPGNYTLTLQFADGAHQSYGKPMSNTISIKVE